MRTPCRVPPTADERDAKENKRSADGQGIEKDGRQPEEQEEVNQDRAPHDIGQPLDGLPVPAEPSLSVLVGGQDKRNQQKRGQRAGDEKCVSTNPRQRRAWKRFACCRSREGDFGRGGQENIDPVIVKQDVLPPPPGWAVE